MAEAKTKYRVLNPRNLPSGIPILTIQEKSKAGLVMQEISMTEGEVFIPPNGMTVKDLLARGQIERA
jgi:hypothetical protein